MAEKDCKFKRLILIAPVVAGVLILTAIMALPVWLFYRLFFGWLQYWHVLVFMIVGETICTWLSFARGLRERSLIIRITEQIIFVALFILFVAFLTDKIFYSQDSQEQSSGEIQSTVFISEAEAVKIATAKAKELGYPVEEMNIQSKIKDNEVVVYFQPKALQLGGDLTIRVDMENSSVIDVIRGQ